MAIVLDGSAHANGSGGSVSATLTTAGAGVVVAVLTINGVTASSIAATGTSGWALRKRVQVSGQLNYLEEWAGVSSGALAGVSVTATLSGSSGFVTMDAFGVSSADTGTIWDANGALPDGQDAIAAQVAITTTQADTMLLAAYRFSSTSTPTQGTGWTKISGANFQLVEYKVVSSAQSATAGAIGTGLNDQNSGIGDAIRAFTPGASIVPQAAFLMGMRRAG